MSDERFENVMFFLLGLGIVSALLLIYSFYSEPNLSQKRKPMPEPAKIETEKRIKIAVIDTGIEVNNKLRPYLCRGGHYSLVDGTPFTENHFSKHGTNIAGLIAQHMNPSRECLIIIKFYHKYLSPVEFVNSSKNAIEYAIKQGVKYINMSYGGVEPQLEEFKSIQKALKLGIKISVCAGNENINFDSKCGYFPACYETGNPNFHVVGSSTGDYSNSGSIVKYLEDGTDKGTPVLRGTSQATAIHTGKWIRSSAQ